MNYDCEVIKIVDGDTVDCILNLGFNITIKQRVRLYGINTPESRTTDLKEKEKGIASKNRLEQILKDNGMKCVLKSYGVGKFGWCLGVILIKNENINKKLVEEGWAKPYFGGKRG